MRAANSFTASDAALVRAVAARLISAWWLLSSSATMLASVSWGVEAAFAALAAAVSVAAAPSRGRSPQAIKDRAADSVTSLPIPIIVTLRGRRSSSAARCVRLLAKSTPYHEVSAREADWYSPDCVDRYRISPGLRATAAQLGTGARTAAARRCQRQPESRGHAPRRRAARGP